MHKDANTFGDAHELLFIFLCFSTRPTWIGEQEATFVACAIENVLKSARDQSGEPKTLQKSGFDCLRSSELVECGFHHVWSMINAGFDIAFLRNLVSLHLKILVGLLPLGG